MKANISSAVAPSAKPPVKVVLVEDKAGVRDSWCKLINSLAGFSCVTVCSSGEEALRVIPPIAPDVVLMDIFLPRMSGIECTTRLKSLLPKTQILILTAVEDDELVFMALEAGADGYLLKRTKPEDLRAAMLDVLGGGAPVWLLDPRDAQYLNTTVEELRKAVGSLAVEGLLRATDAEYGAATEKLMERREEYVAQLERMLAFIRPSFNEEMRHGLTNM